MPDYQGWKNYETWGVHLWITNEEGSYDHWRERAAELREEYEDEPHEVWSEDEFVTFTMADEMKEEFEQAADERLGDGPDDVFNDLLQGALDSVDWQEIAASLAKD